MNVNINIDPSDVIAEMDADDLAQEIYETMSGSEVEDVVNYLSHKTGVSSQRYIETPTMADVEKFEIVEKLFENKTLQQLQELL